MKNEEFLLRLYYLIGTSNDINKRGRIYLCVGLNS